MPFYAYVGSTVSSYGIVTYNINPGLRNAFGRRLQPTVDLSSLNILYIQTNQRSSRAELVFDCVTYRPVQLRLCPVTNVISNCSPFCTPPPVLLPFVGSPGIIAFLHY